jgi:hypothetical protein
VSTDAPSQGMAWERTFCFVYAIMLAPDGREGKFPPALFYGKTRGMDFWILFDTHGLRSISGFVYSLQGCNVSRDRPAFSLISAKGAWFLYAKGHCHRKTPHQTLA